jgi:polysaccharide export outer membrane protein
MAADRTVPELQDAIGAAYGGVLLRPDVTVLVKTSMPLKVFVLGEVGTPGVYDMPGDINALQAIAQAGGFKTSAKVKQVVVIRRGPGGVAMARTVDLARGLKDPAHADLVPLRRFDVIYVPRTGVAEAGLFVQQYFRDLSPVQLGFSYTLGAKTIN